MSLVVTNLSVDHGAIRAISGVSFTVESGKIAAVIGSNGAGKTTLLRTLSGLKSASHGSAQWNQHDLFSVKPEFNVPSTEKTEIRVATYKNTFYVAVVCYDSTPENIVVSDSRRDSDLNDEDSFLFILDTYNDLQNGFLFGTNSNGMEYDAQIDNEGQGNFSANRQQGGVIGGTNINWDATWSVKTETGNYGWSAEFAIPLRSLRFKSGDKQTWGINFQRNISPIFLYKLYQVIQGFNSISNS